MNEEERKFTVTIGSEGFVECDLLNESEYKIIPERSKIIKMEEVINQIREYYNSHHTINGRPPSKKFFNEFLDTFIKK